MAQKKQKLDELMFRGRPVVRRDNAIYYGFIDDKFLVKLSIKETETLDDLLVSSKIVVQLITNNTYLKGNERMIKRVEREGLYDALDIAAIWLADMLEEEE